MQAPVREAVDANQQSKAGGLVGAVISDAQRLISLEIALAKQEMRELAKANAIAAAILVFGGLLVALGVLVAVPVLVVEFVPWHWQAAVVWAVAYVVLGGILVLIGKVRLRIGPPPRTIESLKENKEWALRRVRSNGK